MPANTERGFSLIELLLVVVVIGIVAAVAFPALQKSIWAAQRGSTIATLRTISSTEMSFYSQKGRFGRLTEINNILGGAIGTPVGTVITREKFDFRMSPRTPTDLQLQNGYRILARRTIANEGITYIFELTQTGEIRQIFP